MGYLGIWHIDDPLAFYLSSATYSTGAATDADSAPAYRVYEDETATPILAGTMALLDGGNTAGFYSEQITLSAANGFEIGKQYAIYISYAVATIAQATHHTFQVEAPITLGAAGAPVNTTAASATITTGTQSSGTYASTVESNDTRHTIADSAGTLDMYYEFSVGGDGVANTVIWEGYVSGAGDSIGAYMYNWTAVAWQQVGIIDGKNQVSDDTHQWSVTTAHTGTGANLGIARLRFYGTGLTTSTLNTDRLLLGYAVVNRSVGYVDGAVWLDTVSGVAGTEPFVNGTADRPSDTLANVLSIAGALGVQRIYVLSGSLMTLAAAFTGKTVEGDGYTVVLNGQDITGSIFRRFAFISGTATGTLPAFNSGRIGNVTLPPCIILSALIAGTFTLGSAGTYLLADCVDGNATGVASIIDFGSAIGASNVAVRNFAGGLEIQNMKAGDYLSVDGNGRLRLNANCTGGEVRIRGAWDLENFGSGQTITDSARWNRSQVSHNMHVGH